MSKQLESIAIHRAKTGGHIVKHQFAAKLATKKGAMSGGLYMDHPEPEEHVFGKNEDAKMLAHVTAALGCGKGEED